MRAEPESGGRLSDKHAEAGWLGGEVVGSDPSEQVA